MPCCISTTSESQPILAMTSAEKLLGIPHQLLMTARPCCQASRTPFGRAMCSSYVFRDNEPIPPVKLAGVKVGSRLLRRSAPRNDNLTLSLRAKRRNLVGCVSVENLFVDDVVADRLAGD